MILTERIKLKMMAVLDRFGRAATGETVVSEADRQIAITFLTHIAFGAGAEHDEAMLILYNLALTEDMPATMMN